VGRYRALELLVTGEPMAAAEAHRLGLVCRLADDPDAAARELAEAACENAPLAVEAAKQLVREGPDASLETALSLEQEVTFRLFGTDDVEEGIAAFREKRDPEFAGE
jgi:enoyl-CoA hydratase/carnithine racemase